MSMILSYQHSSHQDRDHDHCIGNNCPCKIISYNLSIWTCAGEGNLGMIQKRIAEKPELVRLADPYGYLPLHFAAQRGHITIVNFFIQNGSPIDGYLPPEGCGATPLHRCAFSGHLDICKILVEAGADIDAVDTSFRDNRTPLMKAASQSHLEVIEYLLSIGANPDLRDSKGCSYQDILQFRENDLSIPPKDEHEKELKNLPSLPQPVQTPSSIFICPMCKKETFSVRKRRGLLICLNC